MSFTVTKLVHRPDGMQVLKLRTATVTAVEGPDKGRSFIIDRPRVTLGNASSCEIQLSDPTISRVHAEIRAAEDGYILTDLDSTNGTLIAGVRVHRALLEAGVHITLGSSVLHLSPQDNEVDVPLSPRTSFGELIGQSIQMRHVFAVLERLAAGTTTVLLEGESGTGKEVAASSIHAASPRADQPFIVVDCGAIPAALIESELFGHERGAFTGAADARTGALQEADGGTVFLDEIGELSLELQPKLLRFLESRQIKPVGATRHQKVDVRVIAATNRKLSDEVQAGRFREDLFYRLSVVRVELPPLRDRPDDIRLMAHHFAQEQHEDSAAVLTPEVEALLTSYSWPGNSRQLRHVVEQLLVLPEYATRALRDDNWAPKTTALEALVHLPFHEARRRWQEMFEREYVQAKLEHASGVVSHAAAQSGLPRQTFHRLLRRHGIRDR